MTIGKERVVGYERQSHLCVRLISLSKRLQQQLKSRSKPGDVCRKLTLFSLSFIHFPFYYFLLLYFYLSLSSQFLPLCFNIQQENHVNLKLGAQLRTITYIRCLTRHTGFSITFFILKLEIYSLFISLTCIS